MLSECVCVCRLSDQTGELKCEKLDEGDDVDEGLLTDDVRCTLFSLFLSCTRPILLFSTV